MDAFRFDRLAKIIATTGTRRAVLALLAALPVAAGLVTPLPGTGEAAAGRHRRKARFDRGARRKHGKGKGKGKAKGAKKKHKPNSPPPAPVPPPPDPCTDLRPSDDLQAAIDAANPGDTVTLCAGRWRLPATVTITKNLTLQGAGAGQTMLDGRNSVRVLDVASGVNPSETVTVTLQDLMVTRGLGNAGAGIFIAQAGDVTLRRVSVAANLASQGGGINNSGQLTLAEGTVIGGDTPAQANQADSGGGILNANPGTVRLQAGSRVSGNRVILYGGGIYNAGVELELTAGSEVTGNHADDRGGGIAHAGPTINLRDGSRISGNTAGSNGGGGIYAFVSLTVADDALVCDNSSPQCSARGGAAISGPCPNPADGVCPVV